MLEPAHGFLICSRNCVVRHVEVGVDVQRESIQATYAKTSEYTGSRARPILSTSSSTKQIRRGAWPQAATSRDDLIFFALRRIRPLPTSIWTNEGRSSRFASDPLH